MHHLKKAHLSARKVSTEGFPRIIIDVSRERARSRYFYGPRAARREVNRKRRAARRGGGSIVAGVAAEENRKEEKDKCRGHQGREAISASLWTPFATLRLPVKYLARRWKNR